MRYFVLVDKLIGIVDELNRLAKTSVHVERNDVTDIIVP